LIQKLSEDCGHVQCVSHTCLMPHIQIKNVLKQRMLIVFPIDSRNAVRKDYVAIEALNNGAVTLDTAFDVPLFRS
jgi:hypothetical protein